MDDSADSRGSNLVGHQVTVGLSHFDSAHDGHMIKTTGDGVLALFTGPEHGVRCAKRVSAEARDLDIAAA